MIDPVIELLPRFTTNENTRYLLSNSALILDECNNYGSQIIKKYYTSSSLHDDQVIPLLMLRSIVELSDSISVMLANSVMDPGRILLRSLLELYFGLEYLLEGNTKQRALAFIVWNTHQQNKFYDCLNPTTQSGKDFINKLKGDRFASQLKIFDTSKFQDLHRNNEELLNLPEYREIEQIYQKKKKIKGLKWYSIVDDYPNLEQLAKHLHLYGSYQLLYRYWSKDTHGTSISDGKIVLLKDGMTGLIQMRNPSNGFTLFAFAYLIVINSLKTFIENLLQDEEVTFKKWATYSLSRYKTITGKH